MKPGGQFSSVWNRYLHLILMISLTAKGPAGLLSMLSFLSFSLTGLYYSDVGDTKGLLISVLLWPAASGNFQIWHQSSPFLDNVTSPTTAEKFSWWHQDLKPQTHLSLLEDRYQSQGAFYLTEIFLPVIGQWPWYSAGTGHRMVPPNGLPSLTLFSSALGPFPATNTSCCSSYRGGECSLEIQKKEICPVFFRG